MKLHRIFIKKFQIITILIMLLLINTQLIQSEQSDDKFSFSNSSNTQIGSLSPNQASTIAGSTEIFNGIIELLISRKNATGSWELNSLSDDSKVFTGIAGGLAGMGMKFLEVRKLDASWVSSDMNETLLDLANEIGDTLLSIGDINSTHSSWKVYNGSDIIDLGWDFGLAGIAAFFTELYNQSSILKYKASANKTLNAIYDRVNQSGGIHWGSNMHILLQDLDWYPTGDFDFYDDPETVSFSGVSLGTAGIAKAALQYLKDTDDRQSLTAWNLLNGSLDYLSSLSEINGTELSYIVANEYPELKSTSYATGVTGIANLFLDLYDFTANSTYLDNSIAVMHWLNGTNSEESRFDISWEFNGTLEDDIEMGITHGLTGIVSYFLKLSTYNSSEEMTNLARQLTNFIISWGVPKDNTIQFSERVVQGKAQNLGSTAWAFGGGGIFEILMELGNKINNNYFIETAIKLKSYLLSRITTNQNFTVIVDNDTNNPENNPYFGMPSILQYLRFKIPGYLVVKDKSLEFGNVEIGKSSNLYVTLINTGEFDSSANFNNKDISPFSLENSTVTLGERKILLLKVTFSPTAETAYSSQLNISSIHNDFLISLIGNGFDLPILSYSASDANNSFVTEVKEINIEITASDSSTIQKIEMTVGSSTSNLALIPGSAIYKAVWSIHGVKNGTYILIFTAYDILGNSNSLKLVYTIGIYTPSQAERVFSDKNRNILIGSTLVLLIAAIVITKKYMK